MSFLDDLLKPVTTGLGNAVTGAIFGPQDRISHERFMENEARGDIHYKREADRQGTFLKNLAPDQASAHNEYQDATYGQDTERMGDRINNLAGKLGMSPWELTGQGTNTTPIPGGQQQSNTGSASAFMAQMVPLKLAKMQQDTALATTKMQTDTSKYISDQQTVKGEGPLQQLNQAKQQQILTAAQTVLTQAQTSATNIGAERTQQATTLDAIATLTSLLPKSTFQMGPMTVQATENWPTLLEILNKHTSSADIRKTIDKLDNGARQDLMKEGSALAKWLLEQAKKFKPALESGGDAISGFLNQLTGNK